MPGALKLLAPDKAFRSFLRWLFRHDWVVDARPPFGGPQHVLHSLAGYTHRVAISHHGLAGFADGKVTFRWKDYAHGNPRRLMTLTAGDLLRRFLLHTLPRGLVRIRFFGFLANRRRATLLPLCRQLLEARPRSRSPTPPATQACPQAVWLCPRCGGPMTIVARLTAQQIRWESARPRAFDDTS